MVRVPQSQVEANAAEAHRAARRARMIDPPKTDQDDDLFNNVVNEVIGSARMRTPVPRPAPSQTSPAPKVLGAAPIDPRRDVVTQAMDVARAEPAPTAPDDDDAATAEVVEDDQAAAHDAHDAEAMRQSAEAPSAPPMSWPAEKTEADDGPPSDLDALVHAAQQSPAPIAAADAVSDEGELSAVNRRRPDRPDRPPLVITPVGQATASVRGAHGLLGMAVLLLVVVGALAMVGWRNWEHTWNFSGVITRCLPAVSFVSPGDPNEARIGSMKGKILLCNEAGGRCSAPLAFSDDLTATRVDQVGTVIFIRRNDDTLLTQAFREGGRAFAHAPAGYEMCAVDVTSGKRICTVAVAAGNAEEAAERLYWLIKRCVRPPRWK